MHPDPIATYRLQFRPGFGFDQAASIVDYLRQLGVSHVYCAPYLQARAGSTHGYDVVDPTQVSDELGGVAGHCRFCAALAAAGLGQILDIVPNHMAISGPENAWWWDVLENGRSSPYAAFFDIDWVNPAAGLFDRVLLPILGDHYARVLEAKEIRLELNEGRFLIRYHEHAFPIAPASLSGILKLAVGRYQSAALAFLADQAGNLLPTNAPGQQDPTGWRRDMEILQNQLARLCREDAQVAEAVAAVVAEFSASPAAMDRLLEEQHYRLAFWRISSSEPAYRRFFDINQLAGLRVEEESVFAATHALILRWLAEGVLSGVRIDHIDGLLDPTEYLARLRVAAPGTWLLVEKILGPQEQLPSSWPVDGTTGYEFLNLVNGLLIDAEGEKPLTDFYVEFTGQPADAVALIREKKHQVLRELLGGDINRLAAILAQLRQRHWRIRDYTNEELRTALCELAACFPVYRTYVRPGPGGVSKSDRQYVSEAVEAARRFRPELDSGLLDFLGDLLLLRIDGNLERELALRFQQLTGPAMAKGAEDTAFYCCNRLVSLNEVGGHPGVFGVSPDEFHTACKEVQRRWPHAMLSTSTHDTKRSEDVRARISLLSEIPTAWRDAVLRWSAINTRHRTDNLPDRNAEYLLYQTLVGAWPIDADRATAYMQKAAREAKMFTSWTEPDDGYERALGDFVRGVMADSEFTADLECFVESLRVPAAVNALAQTLLKLTAPGVPDIYQGTELWDLSLVDPDNRRPVEYERRRRLLADVRTAGPETVLARTNEGLPKMYVIHKALALRGAHPEWFGAEGVYRPLMPLGRKSQNLVAFVRGENAATVVPRLPIRLSSGWADTVLHLPRGQWLNQLTGDLVSGIMPVAELLRRFPVALLSREEGWAE